MKIILQSNHDLLPQACVAKFALSLERPSDGWTVVHHMDNLYCVRWNKASITVYPQ